MPRDLTVNLRRTSVTTPTVTRYANAIAFFMNFLLIKQIILGPSPSEMLLDETVCDYVQWLYSSALPKYQGNLIFAAVLDLFPRAHLQSVRRMLKAWERIEPGQSAFPCPCLYAVFIVHQILLGSNFGMTANFSTKLQYSIYVLMLFLGLFRPIEIFVLQKSHVVLGPSPCITVRVRGKSEVRHNRPAVAVTIRDPFLHMLLSALLQVQNTDNLFDFSDHSFSRFCQIVSSYWPHFPRIIPYSFKRGGTSDLFRRCGSYDICVEQGRWENVTSARRYIEAATADQMLFTLSPDWRGRFLEARNELKLFASRGGMGGRSRLFDDLDSLETSF